MNELFEGYPFLRVLSKCTHLDYSSLLVPQGPLSSSLGHFDSIHRCHSILYQTCKCSSHFAHSYAATFNRRS